MNRNTFTLLAALALLAVGVVAYLWWPGTSTPPPAPTPMVSAPPPAPLASEPSGAAVDPEVVASAGEPAPEPTATPLPALDQSDPMVKDTLVELAGKTGVLSLLQTDGFLRRLVTTVDNLTRAHAASRLWPANPTAGQFGVDGAGQIEPGNAARYDGFVKLVESVDPARAAAAYRRLYPLLQNAFEELGYPTRRFHGRLLAVIDHLLATPDRPEPLAVTLVEVKGPIVSERPWVRFEFADPQLQALSAGQKIMLRVGQRAPQTPERLAARLPGADRTLSATALMDPRPRSPWRWARASCSRWPPCCRSSTRRPRRRSSSA